MKTKQIKILIVALIMATLWQGCKKTDPDPMPTADFSYGTLSAGDVQFTDKSLSARTYAWDFGNGATSVEKSPKVSFVNNGDYTVKLTVKNNTGENSVSKIITVINGKTLPLTADFSFTALTNGDMQFTDKSISAISYKWDFGYGLTSTDKNPKVSLIYNGDYKVKLTVESKNYDTKTVEKTVSVINGKALPAVTDEWNSTKGTSGGDAYSFRNHFYTFDVTEDNKTVTANVQSGDIDVAFYWYNSLGQDLNGRPSYSRNYTDTQKLNKGKYTLLVTTKNRYAIGKYNLVIRGIDLAPVRVTSTTLKDSKNFAEGAGGSYTYFDAYLSPLNKYYTFNVTEDNTIVDVNVMSNTADTWIKLYNSLGQSLNYIDLSRTPFQIQKLQKGTYTMLLGADFATKTDYTLEINGKVEKLVEKVAAVLKISDKWSANLVTTDGRDYSFDNYAFDVTEDNTWIEVVATSADVENRTNVYDSGGVDVSSAPYFTDKVKRQTFKASKGKYKIYLRSAGKSTAAYNLLVVGQVANLRKL
jgi:PKD repeat protein